MSESFRNLMVWQKAIESSKRIYRITQSFPKEEVYGMTSQIRRASVSIAANIAEGSQRSTSKDFANFLRIADGSAAELETMFLIAKDLFPESTAMLETELDNLKEIQKMLGSLIRKVKP
ncbi:MAG: four helix bundle protein [Candidatus Uhrbacteria bacterium]|nr:four helix bundle protein [Candidatus Uhrbacteria bacterium]